MLCDCMLAIFAFCNIGLKSPCLLPSYVVLVPVVENGAVTIVANILAAVAVQLTVLDVFILW